eukprot:750939-Hanusia_phi.AAC.7
MLVRSPSRDSSWHIATSVECSPGISSPVAFKLAHLGVEIRRRCLPTQDQVDCVVVITKSLHGCPL